jgi:hypothetical protein
VFRSPIRRRSDGTYRFQISTNERALVVEVMSDLRDRITTPDPTLERLFPPPYGDDTERNAGFAAIAGRELLDRRLAAIDLVLATADADRLTAEELEAWMRSINDARLVLGTRLGVDQAGSTPETSDQRTLGAYEYLGFLLELTVRALAD